MDALALVLFVVIELAGVVIAVHWWRRGDRPLIPRQDPRYIFRIVHREGSGPNSNGQAFGLAPGDAR